MKKVLIIVAVAIAIATSSCGDMRRTRITVDAINYSGDYIIVNDTVVKLKADPKVFYKRVSNTGFYRRITF